jgi:hypothetical protein
MLSLPDRILDKLAPCPITGCWHWAARWSSGNGYGKVRYEGKCSMAHRVVYLLLVGSIPEDHVLDHTCRERSCCNPDHLEPVTVQVNTERGDAVLFENGRG